MFQRKAFKKNGVKNKTQRETNIFQLKKVRFGLRLFCTISKVENMQGGAKNAKRKERKMQTQKQCKQNAFAYLAPLKQFAAITMQGKEFGLQSNIDQSNSM